MYANQTYRSDVILACDGGCPNLTNVKLLLRSNLPSARLTGIELLGANTELDNISLQVSGREPLDSDEFVALGVRSETFSLRLSNSEVLARTGIHVCDGGGNISDTTINTRLTGVSSCFASFPEVETLSIVRSKIIASRYLIETDAASPTRVSVDHSLMRGGNVSGPNINCPFTSEGKGQPYDNNC